VFAHLHQLAYVSVQATRLCLASRDNRDNVYQTLRCLGHQRGVARRRALQVLHSVREVERGPRDAAKLGATS